MASPASIDPQWIKAQAAALEFDPVGICEAGAAWSIDFYQEWLDRGYAGTMGYLARSVELRRDVETLLPGAKSVIALGLNYNQPDPWQPGQPRIARYALGRDYHKVLRGRLRELSRQIEREHGGEFRVCVDSAPALEREWAHRSGLGWYGKNTCLINTKRGSWFFIGLLLTTLRIEPDNPAAGGCGTCTQCIQACPTGAIVEHDGRWQVDARRCISYLTIEHKGEIDPELQRGMGEWTFGCDICQAVCPFNQPRPHQPERAQFTTVEDFRARQWPSLAELAEISEEDWDQMTQGSPVRRAGLEGIRRNARINLANQ